MSQRYRDTLRGHVATHGDSPRQCPRGHALGTGDGDTKTIRLCPCPRSQLQFNGEKPTSMAQLSRFWVLALLTLLTLVPA